MNRQISSDASVYRPWGNGNYYSYSSLFFSELKENETWNLSNLHLFSPTFFSFLFMRAFIFSKISGKKLVVESVAQPLKNAISKNLHTTEIPGLEFSEFIPRLIITRKKNINETGISRIRFSDNRFYYYHKTSKGIFRSGGYLKCQSALKEIFEKTYSSISKKKKAKSGNLFFIQNNFSIFGEFEKNKPAKNIFIQSFEKKINSDFLFWMSEIRLSD